METMVLDHGDSAYLVNSARIVKTDENLAEVASNTTADWSIDKSNPFVSWIAGDFVESDKPNENTQFWTASDLALSEYSIRHAPLNMVHKFREPIGFFAATKTVKLKKEDDAAAEDRLKIQALSGLWTHLFPFEAAMSEAADEAGLLFYSMECRGTHLICAGDEGCGEKFEYMKPDDHCQHLQERTSIRHIVNPTFRGGALIVPPVKPGWKNAHASVLTSAVMQEAASFAEENEKQYTALNANGADLSASAWEHLMGLILTSQKKS